MILLRSLWGITAPRKNSGFSALDQFHSRSVEAFLIGAFFRAAPSSSPIIGEDHCAKSVTALSVPSKNSEEMIYFNFRFGNSETTQTRLSPREQIRLSPPMGLEEPSF